MADAWRGIAATAVLLAAAGIGQPQTPSADPSKGFDPNAAGERQTIAARNVQPLQQHGNASGGVDHGPTNAGIIFGTRIYGDNLVKAIELFYYIPTNADRLYREGDYRGSTGPIGGDRRGYLGAYAPGRGPPHRHRSVWRLSLFRRCGPLRRKTRDSYKADRLARLLQLWQNELTRILTTRNQRAGRGGGPIS